MTQRSSRVSRRGFLHVGGLISAGTLAAGHLQASGPELEGERPDAALAAVKALVFDVFGTVVDWRTSVAREVEALAQRKRLRVDAEQFADAWRAGYAPSMNRVRTGALPWTKLDDLHRMILDKILVDFALTGLSEAEKNELNHVWHRLQPWPDAVAGLTRLKRKHVIAPLSNGNISLMTNLAKHSGLPWDCILGAELVRHYKPDREVYESAAQFLGLTPAEVMMVAAHPGDLKAARTVGLRTAFVPRPLEYGPGRNPSPTADSAVDVRATDFLDLAGQMGV
jgi:2-haloacid dehalogenase